MALLALPQAVFPLFVCSSLLAGARRIGTATLAPQAVCHSLIPSSSHCHKTPRQLVKWPVTLMIKPGRVHSAGSERLAVGWSLHKLFETCSVCVLHFLLVSLFV